MVFTLILLTLSGCAGFYQPIPKDYNGETSIINDSYTNKERTKAHYFILYKIDDKYVENSWGNTRKFNQGRGMRFTPNITSRKVMPREQKFTFQGLVFFPTDAQALFGDNMIITKDFVFTPKANETYTIRGKLEKSGSSVWLENSAGEVVEGSSSKVND